MNNRIVNATSYIFSAIIYVDKSKFTSSEIAKALLEKFSLPKNTFKAKAFAYHQLQVLFHDGLLTKTRQKGIYQHLYSKTEKFNSSIQNIELIKITKNEMILSPSENSREALTTVNELIKKYEAELEQLSGAIEIYNELSIELPERRYEFINLLCESERKAIRVHSKIKTLNQVIS